MQDIFSLRRKVFSTHLTSSISDVFTENSYSDVTLVSDDLILFQAHKCVLSASSPVLKNLLLNNPHSQPLIYLRGVKQQDSLMTRQQSKHEGHLYKSLRGFYKCEECEAELQK
eukprot:TRINITY_DN12537_c0_g1_i1.p2 TRINITY_DN12537_c0_g1~~TRINITY_DN12537_c0_g1_i1.p2  ORF type:complete len:113 (-),score=12.32 TRINITY_DN12537_c0_g1_i1:89-427(-)